MVALFPKEDPEERSSGSGISIVPLMRETKRDPRYMRVSKLSTLTCQHPSQRLRSIGNRPVTRRSQCYRSNRLTKASTGCDIEDAQARRGCPKIIEKVASALVKLPPWRCLQGCEGRSRYGAERTRRGNDLIGFHGISRCRGIQAEGIDKFPIGCRWLHGNIVGCVLGRVLRAGDGQSPGRLIDAVNVKVVVVGVALGDRVTADPNQKVPAGIAAHFKDRSRIGSG